MPADRDRPSGRHLMIRIPPRPEQMPLDEPTTVIGRKKRKKERNVTVDKENPSELNDSDLTPIKRFKTETASDLYYSCNIDEVSEAQIADAVHRINYSIVDLVLNILNGVKKFKLSYPKTHNPSSRKYTTPPTEPDSDITCIELWSMLIDSRLSRPKRDSVVEAVLRNLISLLIYRYFFKGGHFFGVGSETLCGYLETMLSKLVTGEKADPIAIQRWRSMSIEAVFQMNGGIEAQLTDQLISELERMLKVAFPLALRLSQARRPNYRSKTRKPKFKLGEDSDYETIVRGEVQLLLDIIRQARNLSLMIQHDIVSCQLLVTISPAATQTSSEGSSPTPSTGDALGTYAFGLQKILGSRRSDLIQPKMITRAALLTI